MNKQGIWFCFFLFFLPFGGWAQHTDLKNDIIQQRIEFISQQYEQSNIDFSSLVELLTYYYDHPINLNSATKEDLESLQLLSPFQIRTLIQHRIKYGEYTTIYELRNLEGFDYVSIQNIVPFVWVAPVKNEQNFNIKKSLKFGRSEIFSLWGQTLEQQMGYTPPAPNGSPNSRYMGDPNRLYFRYRFVHGQNLSFGVTAEKDPGEEFFTGSNTQGFDFYSAHFFARNIGVVNQLAVGDFHAQFGQGLTFWSGFSYRKTADALNVVRYARKLSPYASRNENNFLRGVGTTVKLNNVLLTAFYSNKGIDANLTQRDTLNAQDRAFTSLQESGLHRTPSEIANKNAINEQIMGANVAYSGNNFKIGSRIIHSKYDAQFGRKPQLYQKFLIDTNQWYNAGIDANILFKHMNLFGEFSMSSNGGWAYLGGAVLQLHDRFSLSIVNRNFQPDYLSVYANSFGERADNNNEKGTYLGVKVGITSNIELTAYVDKYQFDWLSYQADGPSNGLDYMARLNWRVNRNLEVYTRYRRETQQKNSSQNEAIRSLAQVSRDYLRFHLLFKPFGRWKLQSRVELSSAKKSGEAPGKGFLLYQDVHYQLANEKTSVIGRAAIFDVDTYDARIYTYENDVLYYFSVPAYYKRGVRGFLVVHHKWTKKIECWMKLSRTFLSHESTFGSGTELINAPHKTEIRIQFRFKF